MDFLIPELDRVCPECGCTHMTCISTTAEKWLGHCPDCDAQVWQELPSGPQQTANQSRPSARLPRDPMRFDPKRVPLRFRTPSSRANKNLPSGEGLPAKPAPNASVLVGGVALRGYGAGGAATEPLRGCPQWVGTVAALVFTACLLVVVGLEVLSPGAVTEFDLFAQPNVVAPTGTPIWTCENDPWGAGHHCTYYSDEVSIIRR